MSLLIVNETCDALLMYGLVLGPMSLWMRYKAPGSTPRIKDFDYNINDARKQPAAGASIDQEGWTVAGRRIAVGGVARGLPRFSGSRIHTKKPPHREGSAVEYEAPCYKGHRNP